MSDADLRKAWFCRIGLHRYDWQLVSLSPPGCDYGQHGNVARKGTCRRCPKTTLRSAEEW